ncbi:MAG: hypothetical protein KF805_02025 [Phycisphaeraceae bacterium]|nr:hypothetical protein [Phycisphaeraceae bacterium]
MTEPAKVPVAFVCPFCGGATPDQPRCAHCAGPLDPLSRQATQNAMGPWFVRDEQQPFRPGCSYETILTMVSRGKITSDTILRGPSTSQFWYPAKRVPGVAHRLGVCHSCQQAVSGESECPRCGAVFHADPDRQFLGLMPVRSLPGASTPVPEPPVIAEPAVAAPAAFPQAFEVSGVAPRASVLSNRMESEIASLRRRNAVLIGVAAVCAIVALGVIWVLASGYGEHGTIPTGRALQAANSGSKESSDSTPGADQAPPGSAELPADSRPNPAPLQATGQKTPPAPESKDPGASEPAKEPAKDPVEPVKPSEELTLLRSTRWP